MAIKRSVAILMVMILPLLDLVSQELEVGDNRIVLTTFASVPFEPQSAMFFIRLEGEVYYRRSPGVVVPVFAAAEKQSPREYVAGVPLTVRSDSQEVEFSTLFLGDRGEAYFLPPASYSLSPERPESLSVQLLRERLFSQKESLRAIEAQQELDTRTHQRLFADAEVISRLERVREVIREGEVLKAEAEAVEMDLERSRAMLASARNLPVPRNYSARQAELNNQIRELTELNSALQSEIAGYAPDWEREFQTQVQMIDETRNDDIEQLEQELQRLQMLRASIGQSAQPGFQQEYSEQGTF